MKKSKYIGQIIDGKWEIIKCESHYYTLINIYNHQIIKIHNKTLLKIINKETSVSRVIYYRILKTNGTKILSN